MQFSIRATRIIEDTFNAINQADEIEGLDWDEYVLVMEYITKELHLRAKNALIFLMREN